MTALEKSEVAKEEKKSEVLTEWPLSVSRELPSDDVKPEATDSAQLEGANPSSSDMPGPAPAAFRWHAVVILISLALSACHFAVDGIVIKFGQEHWSLSLLWSSLSAFHFAWLSQAIVTSLAFALTARLHGQVKSWTADAWFGLIMRFAIMSVPVSWALAYLYCRPVLFMTRCLEGYDYAMALMTLGWTVTLTQGSQFFLACVPSGGK
jgi:hypothetical protein